MPDFSLDSINRSVAVATVAAAAAAAAAAARNTFNDSSSDEEDPDVIARRVTSRRRQQSEFYLNVKQVEEIIRPVWQETPNTPTVAAETESDAATNDVVGDMQSAHARLEWLLRENLRLANQKGKTNSNNNAHKRRKAWKRAQYLQTAMDLKIVEVKRLRRKMRSQHAAAAATINQKNTVLVAAAASSKTAAVNHDITSKSIHEAGNVVLPAHVAAAMACSGAWKRSSSSRRRRRRGKAAHIIGAASNSGSGTCDMIVEKNSFQSAAVSAPASQPPAAAAAQPPSAAAAQPPPPPAAVAAQPAAAAKHSASAQPAAVAQPAAAASYPAPVTKAISNQTSTAAAHDKQQPVLSASTTTTTSLLPVQSKEPQQQQQQQSSAKSGALKNILQTMWTTAGTATTMTNNSNNLPLADVPVWAALHPAAPPPTDLSSLPPPPPYTKRSIAKTSSSNNNNNMNKSAASATTASAAAPEVPSLPQPPAYTQRSSNVTTTTTASKSHNATTSSTTKQSSSLAVAPLTGTANAAVPPQHSRHNSTSCWGGAQSSVVASVTTANGNTLTGTKPVAAAPGGAPSVLVVAAVAQLPQPPATTATTTTQHNATTTSTVAKSSANNNALTPAATQTATTGTATIATTTTAPPPVAQNKATVHGTLASYTKSVVQEAGGRTAPPLPLPEKPQQEAQAVAGTSGRAENATPAPVRRNSTTAATMTTMPHNSTSAQSSLLPPSKQSSNGNATTMPAASSTPNPSTATPAATNFASANSAIQLTPPPEKSQHDSSWPRDMTSPVWKRVEVNVNGYNLSQNEWVDFVQNSVSDAPAHLKGYLRTLAAHENVPRRQPQFENHVHKLLHLQGSHGIATANRLWIFLKEKLEKKTVTALSKQKEQSTASQGGGGLDKSSSLPRNEHHHSEAEQSQESCRRLALSIVSAPSYLRGHMQTIVDLKVVPRTKEELLDVAKKTLNLRDKALDEVWNHLVKHVHSGERPPQHSKTAVSVQPTAARDTRAMSSNSSGANTTAAQPLSFRGHSGGSSVAADVSAAAAAARGYPFSSMSDRFFETATRTVSDIGSAALAAADQARIRDAQVSLKAAGATTARTSSISRAPNGTEKTSATTNTTAPAQTIRPGNALNTASGNANNCTTATQNTALNRRQGTTTGVSAASSVVAAAQARPPENRITLTLAGSQKMPITMNIEADDQKQPFSGFHSQYQTTARGEVRVTFLHEQNAAAIPSATLCKRMKEWDPFWDPTLVLVTDITGHVESPKGKTWARTAGCVTVDLDKIRRENGPKFSQEAKCEWGKRKTTGGLKEGESRLLLKMIPLHPPSGKKAKADGHLWPKGTFLQITTGGAITRIRIHQRKQQQHNEKLWKDMSKYLDLTENLSSNSLQQPFKIEMICHDEEPYFICIAFCRYRSADAIFKMLTTPTSIAPIRRVFESKEEARRKIVDLASSQMIVLDDDDGSSEKEENAGVFSFSLVDSYSKKLIKTPVRGSRCAHFQCFDLEQFIVGNAMVSGNRWRCLVCENFIPISDLELCGLTHSILKEYAGQASSTLNRIEFRSNGTHQLLHESNNRKRAAAPNPQESSNVGDPKRARAADVEVIELY